MANPKSNVILDTSKQFKLKGTLLWPALFTPKQFTGSDGQPQTPKYQATMLFDANADFSTYQNALAELKNREDVKKFGEEWFSGLKKAIRKENDPDVLKKYEFLSGKLKTTASSIYAPTVMKRDGVTKFAADEKDEIYSGCEGLMVVSVGIHNKDKLFLRLLGFQKLKDGEPLGFSGAQTELFESFVDNVGSLAEDDGI